MDWTRGHSPVAALPAGASAKEAIVLRVLSLTRASRMTSAPYLPPQFLAVLFVGRFATTRRRRRSLQVVWPFHGLLNP